ncbi:hypothetical protein E1A91_D05G048800v1 [Gossypium mustelinum]|uniref:Uncharacterized protein n=1 Tax=Gossypium mustelinum TaxID=34275 RepID=A0A5D2UTP7_GOSMU|nr:hypothetical protein E1A91_D05G048800v1 [Gossypium mustelinum]
MVLLVEVVEEFRLIFSAGMMNQKSMCMEELVMAAQRMLVLLEPSMMLCPVALLLIIIIWQQLQKPFF